MSHIMPVIFFWSYSLYLTVEFLGQSENSGWERFSFDSLGDLPLGGVGGGGAGK